MKNSHAVALGQKGGNARASTLTAARRLEISRKANAAKAAKKSKTV